MSDKLACYFWIDSERLKISIVDPDQIRTNVKSAIKLLFASNLDQYIKMQLSSNGM